MARLSSLLPGFPGRVAASSMKLIARLNLVNTLAGTAELVQAALVTLESRVHRALVHGGTVVVVVGGLVFVVVGTLPLPR